MILDSSAILAVLFAETDAAVFAKAISEAESCKISAATFVEVAAVVETQTKGRGNRQLDSFLRRAAVGIEPVTEEQAHIAREAYSDFGKGRHPAGLNFGDCFSYALAKVTGEKLLFKGNDFSKTDIFAAVVQPAGRS
jgi:ribonuclease VapC